MQLEALIIRILGFDLVRVLVLIGFDFWCDRHVISPLNG